MTIYANKLYAKAVKQADKSHSELGERIYVVSSWGDISHLVVLNRDKFRDMKRALNLQGQKISDLMEGAWYYTPDRSGKHGLTNKEKEIRRLAFVRHILLKAKL